MNNNDIKKLIKQLIKKYHPDLSQDANTETANIEITKKLTNILNDLKIYARNKQVDINEVSNEPAKRACPLENQDYLYYKLGIKYYKNIHPNLFINVKQIIVLLLNLIMN